MLQSSLHSDAQCGAATFPIQVLGANLSPLQGTNVIPLLSSVHGDPTQFKDPASFNPANFLDEEKAFKSNEAFMPFAPGTEEARHSPYAHLDTCGNEFAHAQELSSLFQPFSQAAS